MPDPANATGDSSGLWLLLLLVLLLCDAFCTAAESAMMNFSETRLHNEAEGGSRKARRLLELLTDPSRTAAALHTGSTVTAFITAALAAVLAARRLWPSLLTLWRVPSAFGDDVLYGLTVALTLVLAYALLVLGELLPNRVGAHHPESVLLKTAWFWRFYAALNRGPAALFSGTARLLARLFGIDPAAAEDAVTEEDIRELMDAGEETGVLEGSQKNMIENIFDFDDITAAEIMTPRTDVEALDITDPVDEALALATREGFSRLPLYEEDIDHIVGVLYIKDLLPYVGKPMPGGMTLRELSREAYFVPGTKRGGELFAALSERHLQMAVVVDEYGGVAGIVTMEDLLESIVGNMQDEFDHEEEEVKKTGENSFEVDGSMSMEELCELWEITPPTGDFDTVAGFILDVLGRIPAPQEHPRVVYNRLTLTVLSMDDRRIDKVHVLVAPPETEEVPPEE